MAKLCQCKMNCGLEVKNPNARFIKGHHMYGNKNLKGHLFSEESKQKLREKRKYRIGILAPSYGMRHSEETKKFISKLHKGNKYNLGRKATDNTRKKLSALMIGNNYSKGFKWSKESKRKASQSHKGIKFSYSHKEKLREHLLKLHPQENYIFCGGYREDLNEYFRSSWEANFARILKYKKVKYEYEIRRFRLVSDDGNELIFIPDFYIPKYDIYIEIKGRWTKRDEDKLEAFTLYCDKKIIYIFWKEYSKLIEKYKNYIKFETSKEYKISRLKRQLKKSIIIGNILSNQLNWKNSFE